MSSSLVDARMVIPLVDPSEVRIVAPMHIAVREGDLCEGLFVVGAGSLVATVTIGDEVSIVDTLEPGDVFGDLVWHHADRLRHVITVTAMQASRLSLLPPDAIVKLSRDHPDACAALEAMLDEHRRRRIRRLTGC
jgi:CRP-like cAMP-binding protein